MPGEANAFKKGIKELWHTLPPQAKAFMGASAGFAGAATVALPAMMELHRRMDKGVKSYKNLDPKPIGQARTPTLVLDMIRKFKAEHPETKAVPVFASGKVDSSLYVSATHLSMPMQRKAYEELYGITKPGVYLKDKDASTALHELGHASLSERFPKISVSTHFVSLASLPLLALAIFKKSGVKPSFIESVSPLIAIGLQVPRLAEEARASIMAHKTLKREGIKSKGLIPAWGTYLAASTLMPAATLGAVIAKRI